MRRLWCPDFVNFESRRCDAATQATLSFYFLPRTKRLAKTGSKNVSPASHGRLYELTTCHFDAACVASSQDFLIEITR